MSASLPTTDMLPRRRERSKRATSGYWDAAPFRLSVPAFKPLSPARPDVNQEFHSVKRFTPRQFLYNGLHPPVSGFRCFCGLETISN